MFFRSVARPADVRLEVFCLLGKRIRVLDRGFKSGGKLTVRFDATGLATGVYFYTLRTGDFSLTKKMVVLR